MLYRIRMDFPIQLEADARALFNLAKARAAKAKIINLGKDSEEKPRLELERCYHDEVPTKPCEIIDEVKF